MFNDVGMCLGAISSASWTWPTASCWSWWRRSCLCGAPGWWESVTEWCPSLLTTAIPLHHSSLATPHRSRKLFVLYLYFICTAPVLYNWQLPVLHFTVLYCTVLNCTVLNCTKLYCTVLYFSQNDKFLQLRDVRCESEEEGDLLHHQQEETLYKALVACLTKEEYRLGMDCYLDTDSRIFFFMKTSEGRVNKGRWREEETKLILFPEHWNT